MGDVARLTSIGGRDKMTLMEAYRQDFRAWAYEQADAVERRSANELDWENVAEELRSLGNQVQWELYNRFRVLLIHLLKWRYQSGRRSRSWRSTILVQRQDIERLLRQNPSLKAVQKEELTEAYKSARAGAALETKMDMEAFPETLPFTLEQTRDFDFLPETD